MAAYNINNLPPEDQLVIGDTLHIDDNGVTKVYAYNAIGAFRALYALLENQNLINETAIYIQSLQDLQAEYEASIADTGWFVVGDFATGFTYTARNQVGRDTDGELWSYNGPFTAGSFVVAPGTVPTEPTYTNRGDAALRSELGTAAFANVTTSSTDTTAGRATKVGDYGNGRPINQYTDWYAVPWAAPGKYWITDSATNRPTAIPANFYSIETVGNTDSATPVIFATIKGNGNQQSFMFRVDPPYNTAGSFTQITEISTVNTNGLASSTAINGFSIPKVAKNIVLRSPSTVTSINIDASLFVADDTITISKISSSGTLTLTASSGVFVLQDGSPISSINIYSSGNVRLFKRADGNFNLQTDILNTFYAQNNTAGTIASNATVAGSSLVPSQSGTWRNISGNDILAADYGLWRLV